MWEIKKQSVHYRILRSYKDTLHGPSVIIGFQKTQIYQRFAGSQQEVFILNISVQNCYLGNNVTQAIFPHKIVQNIIGCITNFLLLSICKCDAVLISVKTNAILQSFPEKDRFSAANNAFFEIRYGFEAILFSRIKRIFHILSRPWHRLLLFLRVFQSNDGLRA